MRNATLPQQVGLAVESGEVEPGPSSKGEISGIHYRLSTTEDFSPRGQNREDKVSPIVTSIQPFMSVQMSVSPGVTHCLNPGSSVGQAPRFPPLQRFSWSGLIRKHWRNRSGLHQEQGGPCDGETGKKRGLFWSFPVTKRLTTDTSARGWGAHVKEKMA